MYTKFNLRQAAYGCCVVSAEILHFALAVRCHLEQHQHEVQKNKIESVLNLRCFFCSSGLSGSTLACASCFSLVIIVILIIMIALAHILIAFEHRTQRHTASHAGPETTMY